MKILEVKNLSVSYNKKKILKNVSFSLNKGEILGILGANGSGKSTLLKAISNILPYRGEIFIKEKEIKKTNKKELAKTLTLLPQESNFNFPLTVYEMVLMGRNPHISFFSLPSKKDKQITEETIKFLKIEHLKNLSYTTLSGGQKKLTQIARALAQNTEILLLDEPTNHLDFKNQYFLLEKIKEISQKKSITCIITFHNPNLAYKYCDKILMLKDKKILSFGKTKEILNEENLKKLYDTKIKEIKTEKETFFSI
jgi:iron complex transport system ATP-binding protein